MEGKSRRKRAWTFPGTLWCGVGSKATRYDQLGMFESADRCCREHDHCEHIIPAFTVNYGVFNPNFFTISHCDCDQRFRQCLLGVNETISAMVGFSFFNIFKVPCFELVQRMQCTEMYWWGMCKETKEAPYAVFQNPAAFNTTHTPSKHNDAGESHMRATAEGDRVVAVPPSHSNRKPSTAEISKQSGSSHRCTLRDPPRGDTFHRKKRKGLGCKRNSLLLCGTLKHLDECRYKIPPLKKKYHLRNMESKTIYHCDCTSR
ncbi:phospholipase A2 isozymes PA3A/PA3B/PA5-like [Lampris incognitus]|uniref:phospholipase A2 isozymes PA3A/PA3B/PA5-like n=1 Tax=Lampris incognitus TaxID=2546036 RepID=UPI0024B59498|nr:phospholipase A2 isozymes PA3A/PA3B/PA5-like [Lampris incognitus]